VIRLLHCIAYAPRQTSHQRRLQQQARNRKSRGISSHCSSKHEECSKEEEEKKQGGFAYCPTGSSVTSPDGLVKKTIILAIRALASHFWIKNCTKSKKRVRASSELWKRTKPSDCLESARVVVSRSVWCRCCLWWVGGLVGGCVSERASKQASIGYSHGRAPELRKRLQVAAVRMTSLTMALSELLLEAILVLFLSLFFSPPISFISFGFLQQTLLCCFAHSLVLLINS